MNNWKYIEDHWGFENEGIKVSSWGVSTRVTATLEGFYNRLRMIESPQAFTSQQNEREYSAVN